MIFGECPHCNEPITIGVPEDIQLPTFGKVTCDSCGKWFWEKISRIEPEAFLPDEIEVDEERKTVKLKNTLDKG